MLSKLNVNLEFNEKNYVVTLLNTNYKTVSNITGHNVILVEGVKEGKPYIRQCDIKAGAVQKGYEINLMLSEGELTELEKTLLKAPTLIKTKMRETNTSNGMDKSSFYIYGISDGKDQFTKLDNIEQLNEINFNEMQLFVSPERNKEIYQEIASKNGHASKEIRYVITSVRIFKSYYEGIDYKKFSFRSFLCSPENCEKMLSSIKQDYETTVLAESGVCEYIPYNIYGRYSLFSEAQDNCCTWCIEKLKLASINISLLPMDYFGASPEKHVKPGAGIIENSLDVIKSPCVLF